MTSQKLFYYILVCTCVSLQIKSVKAQEMLAPLMSNEALIHASKINTPKNTAQKPTALTLPFFDDFTNDGPYPDASKWANQCVWINNNMAVKPLSRGVATFDALNAAGVPYDTMFPQNTLFADTLTSLPIDLSSFNVGDSLYLSFYYQPQGYGFFPKIQDSLILQLHLNNGTWQQVWAVPGTTLDSAFTRVMIPITQVQSFYDAFEFRFLNKATIGISNSHWHIDYVKLDANRNNADTLMNDVAYTVQPTSILANYTKMPYQHFATNPAGFLKPELLSTFQNNGYGAGQVNYGYNAVVTSTGSNVGTGSGSVAAIIYQGDVSPVFEMYNVPNAGSNFTIKNTFYLSDIYPQGAGANDTIVQYQSFDNQFAYDDGTQEKAYFLNLASAAPGKIAMEYALYQPDTLRGLAIKFVRQVPSAAGKDFSLVVYRSIAINGANDDIIYQQDYYFPQYEVDPNGFSIFKFDQPVPMDGGVYYVGLTVPAAGVSDSLMIGLDYNRLNGTHRYYNVLGIWEPSLLQGALMMRPIVGAPIPVSIDSLNFQDEDWSIYPNPTNDYLTLTIKNPAKSYSCRIIDNIGKEVFRTKLNQHTVKFNLNELSSGLYFIELSDKDGRRSYKRFVHQ